MAAATTGGSAVASVATAATVTASNKSVPLLCRGHSRPVVDVSFSPITPDGFFLVSGCLDGKPMLRDGATGDWIGTFEGHKGAVWSARFNKEATRVITGSADYTAKLWDALTGEVLNSYPHKKTVKTVAFSPDETKLLTGGLEPTLHVLNLEQGTELQSLQGHTDTIKIAQWNQPAGDSIIISGGSDSALRVWDLRENKEVKSIPTKDPITSIELSLDAKYLTVTHGKEVSFYNPSNFDLIKSFSLSTPVNSASIHPDATKFVVGSSDLWVRVVDFANGQELELHKGHHGPVHCIRYAPDGELYASGSEDGTIRLWQTVPKNYGLWQLANNGSN